VSGGTVSPVSIPCLIDLSRVVQVGGWGSPRSRERNEKSCFIY
jgi:hypothetical protein